MSHCCVKLVTVRNQTRMGSSSRVKMGCENVLLAASKTLANGILNARQVITHISYPFISLCGRFW